MSHSQFHCTGRVYLDLHGLIFETSICYWQDQPGSPCGVVRAARATAAALPQHPRRGGEGGSVGQSGPLERTWTGGGPPQDTSPGLPGALRHLAPPSQCAPPTAPADQAPQPGRGGSVSALYVCSSAPGHGATLCQILRKSVFRRILPHTARSPRPKTGHYRRHGLRRRTPGTDGSAPVHSKKARPGRGLPLRGHRGELAVCRNRPRGL